MKSGIFMKNLKRFYCMAIKRTHKSCFYCDQDTVDTHRLVV